MTTTALINIFSLNTSSGIPIYRQLIDQIKQAIRMELVKVGEQLPSVRSLASELQINPMTISKAFAQLEHEGVLIRKRGVGMIVAQTHLEKSIAPELENALSQFIQIAREQNLDTDAIMTLVQQSISVQLKGE